MPEPTIIRSIEEMQRILRERVEQIKIRHEDIDARAGWADGYASKVLSIPPMRKIDRKSMFLLAGAVGFGLALVEDEQALARAKREAKRRKITRKKSQEWRNAKALGMIHEMAVTNGQVGGRIRAQNLSREHQSRAAKIRWRKWRRARREATNPSPQPAAGSAPSGAAASPRTRARNTRRQQSAEAAAATSRESPAPGSRSARRGQERA